MRMAVLRGSARLAAFVAVAALGAACGGDDAPSAEPGETTTSAPASSTTAEAPQPSEAEAQEPDAEAQEPEDEPAVTTTTATITTEAREPAVTTTVPQTDAATTPDPVGQDPGNLIELVVTGGDLIGGARTERVPLGEEVVLRVTGDSDDEVHVHGYDLFVHLSDGEGELTFTADIPGVFEVELEGSHQLLVSLEVS